MTGRPARQFKEDLKDPCVDDVGPFNFFNMQNKINKFIILKYVYMYSHLVFVKIFKMFYI